MPFSTDALMHWNQRNYALQKKTERERESEIDSEAYKRNEKKEQQKMCVYCYLLLLYYYDNNDNNNNINISLINPFNQLLCATFKVNNYTHTHVIHIESSIYLYNVFVCNLGVYDAYISYKLCASMYSVMFGLYVCVCVFFCSSMHS